MTLPPHQSVRRFFIFGCDPPPLRRLIQTEILDPLALKILDEEGGKQSFEAKVARGKLQIIKE